MKLHIKRVNLQTAKPVALLHATDAQALGVHPADRVLLRAGIKSEIAITDVTTGFVKRGQIALSNDILAYLGAQADTTLEVTLAQRPKSSLFMRGENRCKPYTRDHLVKIIKDVVSNALTEAEIAYFISGVNYCGMTIEETHYLIEAIVKSGVKISWGKKAVADKHSIGGIPGNRTTPLVVAICASQGVLMPKTSSRAITSAAGTADTIETVAKVDFSISELQAIVKKTGACLVWGGALGLAPADDKLIQIEKMLNLDPEPQLLASILSKKLAVGSTHVLIDIPYGPGAKVSRERAIALKKKFVLLGRRIGLKLRVALTDGSQPIGNGIGPALEMRDVLNVLQRTNAPRDLERKAVQLAGILLEMMGKARKGKGRQKAQAALNNGSALAKFKEIIEAQKGSLRNIPEARYKRVLLAPRRATINAINNKSINMLARIAGCPQDKAAGVYLHAHVGEIVAKGEPLLTLYAESRFRLRDALNFVKENHPVQLE